MDKPCCECRTRASELSLSMCRTSSSASTEQTVPVRVRGQGWVCPSHILWLSNSGDISPPKARQAKVAPSVSGSRSPELGCCSTHWDDPLRSGNTSVVKDPHTGPRGE